MEGITGLGEEVPTDKSREDNLTDEVTFYPREKEPAMKEVRYQTFHGEGKQL